MNYEPPDLLFCGTEQSSDSDSCGCDVPFFRPVQRAANTSDLGEADTLISSALGGLSLEDREKMLEEIHGVNDTKEESPEFILQKIENLRFHLSRLSRQDQNANTKAFRIAEQQNAEFVYDARFCRRFLRASEFNVAEAAKAVLIHYTWKLELWGESKLSREIVTSDVGNEEMAFLRKGVFQLLPQRDKAGRPVAVVIVGGDYNATTAQVGRAMWYFLTKRLDQPEDKMVVGINIYLGAPPKTLFESDLLRLHGMLPAFASKLAANHHCICDSSSFLFKEMLKNFLLAQKNITQAAKIKVHTGSLTEQLYSLMGYGIPHQLIPVTEDGNIKLKNHLEHLLGKRTRDNYFASGNFRVIFLPQHSDILLGRGKPLQQVAGNLRLAAIVDAFVPEYHSLVNKHDKTALASKIVQMVKNEAGSRFLIKDKGVWVEVPDDVAREKISSLFRSLYRNKHKRSHTSLTKWSEPIALAHKRSLLNDSPIELHGVSKRPRQAEY